MNHCVVRIAMVHLIFKPFKSSVLSGDMLKKLCGDTEFFYYVTR